MREHRKRGIRMKLHRRSRLAEMTITILMAAILIMSAAACTDTAFDENTEKGTVENTEKETVFPAETQAHGFREESGKTISVYCLGPDGITIWDYTQNETVQRLEERYGVKFSFFHPIWENSSKELEEMFRKGDYCDIIYLNGTASGQETYKGGAGAAVSDGVFWDLTDYVQLYMPNYCKWIHSDEELLRMAYDDDGRICGLQVLLYDAVEQEVTESMAVGGLMVRGDWLDASGLDAPVTYQDWEEMLTVFRDKYGCSQPLYISGKGYSTASPGFSSGLGAIPIMQMKGGTVEYGPMTEGWRAYVALMHDWYEKGLIGSEYIANDKLFGIDTDACISEETGAGLCVWSWVDGIEEAISQEADFRAVQYPVTEEGQTAQGGDPVAAQGTRSIHITTAVTKEELPGLLSMLDDFYDADMAFELAYGTEGDTYTRDGDGKPEFTDKILCNEGGFSASVAMDTYLMPVNLMPLRDWSRELNGISEENLEMCRIWDRDGHDLYVPPVTLSTAEQEIYDIIMKDVEDYVEEMTNKMIVGAVDIESAWDMYVRTLQDMGIEEAVAAYQAAYNRYVHR